MSNARSEKPRPCPFCTYGESPSPAGGPGAESVVYKDDQVIALVDIRPVNEGHTLVIPRGHYPHLSDVPEPTWLAMASVGRRVATAIRQGGLRCEGINLFYADGAPAGQEVPHSHLHVFPRFRGDRFKLDSGQDQVAPSEELKRTAAKLRAALPPL